MISVKNLSKKFKNETAIDYKDMSFESGKSYVLLGASGCGKSTLLNMIAGILSPENGEIVIDGQNMTHLSQKEKDLFRIKKIGYIFQDFKLISDMTVMDNINILKLEGVDVSSADEILKSLDIFDKKNKKVISRRITSAIPAIIPNQVHALFLSTGSSPTNLPVCPFIAKVNFSPFHDVLRIHTGYRAYL